MHNPKSSADNNEGKQGLQLNIKEDHYVLINMPADEKNQNKQLEALPQQQQQAQSEQDNFVLVNMPDEENQNKQLQPQPQIHTQPRPQPLSQPQCEVALQMPPPQPQQTQSRRKRPLSPSQSSPDSDGNPSTSVNPTRFSSTSTSNRNRNRYHRTPQDPMSFIRNMRQHPNCIHLIPIIVVLCFLILWWFSRVNLVVNDGRIVQGNNSTGKTFPLNGTVFDVNKERLAVLAVATTTNPSVLALPTTTNHSVLSMATTTDPAAEITLTEMDESADAEAHPARSNT